ncbi:I78 family peptidase inhibitor [Gymnodinialimonas sp. 2305UL16-5]|uniref:I78 family peptidase inhibitor n=1 Tax=Gymnodinialimonas mytili TaxID=3126503 RepID=UPI00309CB81C
MRRTFLRPELSALILAPAMILAGCQGEADTCNSAGYSSLVGSNIAAVTLPADLNMRIIGPDDLVTTDFAPERLNIEVDATGTIQRLTCG